MVWGCVWLCKLLCGSVGMCESCGMGLCVVVEGVVWVLEVLLLLIVYRCVCDIDCVMRR